MVDKAMIYYRVAWKTKQSSEWQWKSTKLESIAAVLAFLKVYNALPKDSLRVFLSSSVETMDEMLERENRGQISNSIRADELLRKTINAIEVRRLEMELSLVDAYDTPYVFALPTSAAQKQAWLRLMKKVRSGELVS